MIKKRKKKIIEFQEIDFVIPRIKSFATRPFIKTAYVYACMVHFSTLIIQKYTMKIQNIGRTSC